MIHSRYECFIRVDPVSYDLWVENWTSHYVLIVNAGIGGNGVA